MAQVDIEKLEKEIEKKLQVSAPVKMRKGYKIDVQRLKKLAEKIREFEAQSDAPAVR